MNFKCQSKAKHNVYFVCQKAQDVVANLSIFNACQEHGRNYLNFVNDVLKKVVNLPSDYHDLHA